MGTRGVRDLPLQHDQETRLTLTQTPDPQDAARADADEAHADADGVPEETTEEPEREPDEEPTEPGVGEAIGGVRAAFMRMLDAHITLLRAELEITGKEIGIIAGLALGALAIAFLVLILLYVGSFLFFGELLFGSMGWGIIHGTLLGAAIVGFVAINLAGGDVTRYGWGAAIGVVVGIVVAALLLGNVGNTGGEALKDWLNDAFVTEDLPFGDTWLVTLGGLVVGGALGAIVAAVAAWQADVRGSSLSGLIVLGFVLGAFIGALWASTRYDAPDGVLGLALTIGLLTWIIAGILLAYRAGFDPEARYANIIPRESIAAFQTSKDFLSEQWERQKSRMMGR